MTSAHGHFSNGRLTQRFPGQRKPVLVTSDMLLGSIAAARELGVDLSESLAVSGIDPALLSPLSGYLDVQQAISFLNDAAERFNCPHFGFLVAKHNSAVRYGLVGRLAATAANVGEAIESSLRLNRASSEMSDWRLQREQRCATLIRKNRATLLGSPVQLQLLGVTHVFNSLRTLSRGKLQAIEIAFTHSDPRPTKEFQRFFGCPVTFNRDFTGIVFSAEVLDVPLETADPELHRLLTKHVESIISERESDKDAAGEVRHHVRTLLATNSCNLNNIAARLGVNSRTLQRELQRQNITFRQLLGDVRQEISEEYLRHSTISLTELSDILGYRNVSALSRAFKATTGLSPDQWRRVQGRSRSAG